jgi:hypothetical protein
MNQPRKGESVNSEILAWEAIRKLIAVRKANFRLLVTLSAAMMCFDAGALEAAVRKIYPDRAWLYCVQSVSRLSRLRNGDGDKHKPCDAQLGDEIEVYVRNLGLWLRDIERIKRIEATNGAGDPEQHLPFKEQELQALVSKSFSKLCLLIDGQPLCTVRAECYESNPEWTPWKEYPLSNRSARRLQDMTQEEREKWDSLHADAEMGVNSNSAEEVRRQVADGEITRTVYSVVRFRLVRDRGDSQSRADWVKLLHVSQDDKRKSLTIGLVADNGNVDSIPTLVLRSGRTEASKADTGSLERQFSFDRLPLTDPWVITGGIALLLATAACWWLARDTSLLRDGNGPQFSFSLGRCQMAFWFFLVAWAFLFLWLVTGRGDTDTLTPEALALMGISAATGLGAAFIEKAGGSKARSSKGFVLDLVTESDVQGVSFHRFQMIMWTLVMGIIFVSEVLTRLMMPKLDATLLALVGISSGTYLGFKFTDVRPGTTPAQPQPSAPTPAG